MPSNRPESAQNPDRGTGAVELEPFNGWSALEFAAVIGLHLPWVSGGRLLTEKQLAEQLDISTRQIRELAHRGLPRVRMGGTSRYSELDAHHWWQIYSRRTSAYREGSGSPVKRLTLAQARREVMARNVTEQGYVWISRRLANLVADTEVEGGNFIRPLGDEWGDDVAVPLPTLEFIVELIEQREAPSAAHAHEDRIRPRQGAARRASR